ncbi:hypothetical protein SeMB42_g06633 [Synchytrium endobioticum]|uniref:PPM-type phosphatase domain-containing protein n=1 Tax=Synchytrium endobioticum TaxID=286115 RepID=A0A507CK16_9FUNG|nr:hypothetical protein SeMB42_g06633 [Synchytrium endobioticum]
MPVYGQSTDIGRRATQQDDYIAADNVLINEPSSCCAIFDGHGVDGAKCSKQCTQALIPLLRQHYNQQNPTEWLTSVFKDLHQSLLDNTNVDDYMSGTTSSVMIHVPSKNQLIVGGVGDSKVVLAKKSNGRFVAEQLTTDHNCLSSSELSRILEHGGRVDRVIYGDEASGPLRVFKGTLPYPGLAITRSLGDSTATKIGVLHTPDVITRELSEPDAFVVLASDGIWDAFPTVQEVVDLLAPYYTRYQAHKLDQDDGSASSLSPNAEAQAASTALTQASLEALDRLQLDDNVTNIVVFL